MGGRKISKKQNVAVDEENLDRFAGSSDEEDLVEMKQSAEHQADADAADDEDEDEDEDESVHEEDEEDEDADAEDDAEEEEEEHSLSSDAGNIPDQNRPSDEEKNDEMMEPARDLGSSAKMADVMTRILETSNITAPSVILAKTVTPLQRMQKIEKEQMKAIKQKRQANKERNLTALHIPLSVATSNTIQDGRLSVAKELEQERFHRRVATRGVVALFNAISQHQLSTEGVNTATKRTEPSKLTKHGFLDKIKNAAVAASAAKSGPDANKEEDTNGLEKGGKRAANWDALKDDYMLNDKKNWDQESSEEGSSDEDEPSNIKEKKRPEPFKKKMRRGPRD